MKDLSKDLNGVDFLRECVNALGWRDEYLNSNKTPLKLINEYKKMLTDTTEDEKHTFKFYHGRYPEPGE